VALPVALTELAALPFLSFAETTPQAVVPCRSYRSAAHGLSPYLPLLNTRSPSNHSRSPFGYALRVCWNSEQCHSFLLLDDLRLFHLAPVFGAYRGRCLSLRLLLHVNFSCRWREDLTVLPRVSPSPFIGFSATSVFRLSTMDSSPSLLLWTHRCFLVCGSILSGVGGGYADVLPFFTRDRSPGNLLPCLRWPDPTPSP